MSAQGNIANQFQSQPLDCMFTQMKGGSSSFSPKSTTLDINTMLSNTLIDLIKKTKKTTRKPLHLRDNVKVGLLQTILP